MSIPVLTSSIGRSFVVPVAFAVLAALASPVPAKDETESGDQALLARAFQTFMDGDMATAEKLFTVYIKADPNHAGALSDLGQARYDLGKYSEAKSALDRSIKIDDTDLMAHFRRGLVNLKLFNDDGAFSDFKKVYDKDPEFLKPWTAFNLSAAYQRKGDNKKAEKLIKEAYRQDPYRLGTSKWYYHNLGLILFYRNDHENAMALFKEGIKRFPDNPWFHDLIGISYWRTKRNDEATPWFEKSMALGMTEDDRAQVAKIELPFNASENTSWKVLQGNGGPWSHRGLYNHFSWDLAPMRGGRSHTGTGEKLSDYFCMSEEVLAPIDGKVSLVVDGIIDNPIGKGDYSRPEGNFLNIIHDDDLIVFIAHFKRGSITVKPGDEVKAGDTLGLCGNSGASKHPHIHIMAKFGMRRLNMSRPAEFLNYYLVTDGTEELVKSGVPVRDELIRR